MNKEPSYNETIIIENALRNLQIHSKIEGDWIPSKHESLVDGEIKLHINNNVSVLNVEIKKDVRQYHLNEITSLAKHYKPLIVIAENISSEIKKRLREADIQYLDGAGNIYIHDKKQLIWIDGLKEKKAIHKITSRAFTKTGLKVLYTFLEQADTINLPYREIAQKANVSLGAITPAIASLKESGFILPISKTKIKLQRKKELWERWLTGYREVLKPSLLLGKYKFRSKQNWREQALPAETLWGGEPAADLLTNYLHPEILTVYTNTAKSKLIKDLQLMPDTNGNMYVYQKFWTGTNTTEATIAPPLIIYADLLLTDDPRCIETAEKMYQKYLKGVFND